MTYREWLYAITEPGAVRWYTTGRTASTPVRVLALLPGHHPKVRVKPFAEPPITVAATSLYFDHRCVPVTWDTEPLLADAGVTA